MIFIWVRPSWDFTKHSSAGRSSNRLVSQINWGDSSPVSCYIWQFVWIASLRMLTFLFQQNLFWYFFFLQLCSLLAWSHSAFKLSLSHFSSVEYLCCCVWKCSVSNSSHPETSWLIAICPVPSEHRDTITLSSLYQCTVSRFNFLMLTETQVCYFVFQGILLPQSASENYSIKLKSWTLGSAETERHPADGIPPPPLIHSQDKGIPSLPTTV